MSSTTYIAFASSEHLHTTTDGFIHRMAQNSPRPEPQTIETIMVSFLDEALEAFFVQPQEFLGLSSGMRRIVNMTVDTISKATRMVVTRTARKMDLEQNRASAEYMDTMRLCHTDADGNETWYIAFPIEERLREQGDAAIASARNGYTRSARDQMTEFLLALTDVGLYWYFEEPMKLMKFGPVVQRAVNMGVETTRKATKSTIRKVFPKLEDEQLSAAADYIEALMLKT